MKLALIVLSLGILSFSFVRAVNKYTKEANVDFGKSNIISEPEVNVRTLDRPFRMAKLNMLWTKAQVRLTEPKLKSLFSELKIHDKEEITFKRLKNEGSDKEGLKEAELRKKLIGIMSTYGLLEHFEEVNDPAKYKHHKPMSGSSDSHLNKSLFKDKKLNKLWEKAEHSGFTAEELQALKEEFSHHQDKIDQYYGLLGESDKKYDTHINSIDDKLDQLNEINKRSDELNEESNYIVKANELRDKHREIRDGYDRLHRLSVKGPKSNEFVEPKVQGLWKLATETNFTSDELESLKVELFHYEKRLLKLRHLQVEAALAGDSRGKKQAGEKLTLSEVNDETIKKQARKVEKLHLDLEARIMQKHIEL
uniref:Alpha-2-macroglobulin RAP C-terminal domain-containing protein n=1 Tax=Homalodisca liturata TaxID=320908 RepID=A0A1B6HYS9_9HEMI